MEGKVFLWCWCCLYTIHVFCFSICCNNCCTPVFGFQETCMDGSSLQVRLFLGSVHYCKPQPIKLQDIASVCGKREGWIKMLCSPRHLVTLQQWTAYCLKPDSSEPNLAFIKKSKQILYIKHFLHLKPGRERNLY